MSGEKEILLGLPSQIEIADALMALPPGAQHETVRRMAAALDLLRGGGWEFVEAKDERPKALPDEGKLLPP